MKEPLSRRLLITHVVLITLIVVACIIRVAVVFYYNPLEALYSDMQRHWHNGFDVQGTDLESIFNAPGFEIFMSTLQRIVGPNRTLISIVMALLSLSTPYLWYRWFRELTRNKTISLLGYALVAFLPSWVRIFGFFMDSVILLPLTGAGLWLTFRAARKQTWGACLLAACVGGYACCTKSVALPILVLPWLFVFHQIRQQLPTRQALKMALTSVFVVGCFYGLGPLKVWSHTGCFVPLPDGIYNQRYFESAAHDIEVTSDYYRDNGEYIQVCIWGSSSVCYPPFHPFSEWMTPRQGRYKMFVDYRKAREYCAPIQMSLKDRLQYTWENIIFFFFQYQWPEDSDWSDPFPMSIPTLVRFIWLPLTLFVSGSMLVTRRRDFMTCYFLAVTCVLMFQQTAVMEGRYKKVWESFAIGAFLNVVARSKVYRSWQDGSWPKATAPAIAVSAPPSTSEAGDDSSDAHLGGS